MLNIYVQHTPYNFGINNEIIKYDMNILFSNAVHINYKIMF